MTFHLRLPDLPYLVPWVADLNT